MKVYVITAVHNRKQITERFINDLKNQTYKEEIILILVDDGSTDGTSDMVRKKYPNSIILQGNGKLFWGGSMNKAYKYLKEIVCDDDVIFYSNDDSHLGCDFLDKAINVLNLYPDNLLTGCAYGINTGYYLDGPVYFNLNNSEVTNLSAGSEGNCTSTRALLMKGKVYRELGGFHPVLLPHYASDYEYTIRAYKKGHKIISNPDVRYDFSEDTTGDNSHKNLSIKKVFSKRSKLNPIYKMNFFLMIAPVYKMPAFITYQIRNFRNHERDSGKTL
ncbi:Glycosyl transferase family 2 [Lachnospiraceae bacterium G41]|nr:Glycosyl transferase family 2 [Lachnospiraceae bacterium G41]